MTSRSPRIIANAALGEPAIIVVATTNTKTQTLMEKTNDRSALVTILVFGLR